MYSRNFISGAITFSLLLGQGVLAAPSGIKPFPNLRALSARNGNETTPTPDEICNGHETDDADPQSMIDAWADTTSGEFLDQWITDNGWVDWVRRMDDDYMNNGASTRECSYADSCDPPDGCFKYAKKDAGPLYWILKAASTAHEGFTYYADQIRDDIVYDSLNVDSLLGAFSAELPSGDYNIAGLISGALVMASAVVGPASPILGAAFGITIGAAGVANSFTEDEVDTTADLKSQMAGTFRAHIDAIEQLCNIALTGNPESPDTLPNQSGDWSSSIARYFDGGRFLVNDVSGQMQDVIDGAHGNFQKMMVNVVLRSQGYFFYQEKSLDSVDDCTGSGAFWVQDMCFDLFRFINDGNTISENASGDLIDTLMNDWGYDFGFAYSKAWDCAVAHPDGSGVPPTEDLPTDGSVPECWYNIPIVQGDHSTLDDEFWIDCDDDDINTSGRECVSGPFKK